jgi:uncharacterized protein YceK
MKKIVIVLTVLIGVAGCANIREVKEHGPTVVARLRQECDAGKPSSCVDMAHVQQACMAHAIGGSGLNAEDVSNCASAVRNADANL